MTTSENGFSKKQILKDYLKFSEAVVLIDDVPFPLQ